MLFSSFSVLIDSSCLGVVFEELYTLPAVGQLDSLLKQLYLHAKNYMFQITAKTKKEN